MKPKQVIVTSGTTIVPVDYSSRATSVVATPAGSGNYTVSYTVANLLASDITANYVEIADMTTATAEQTAELGPITALKIELHSGTSVTVDIAQSGD
jgi:hypothetical protein